MCVGRTLSNTSFEVVPSGTAAGTSPSHALSVVDCVRMRAWVDGWVGFGLGWVGWVGLRWLAAGGHPLGVVDS